MSERMPLTKGLVEQVAKRREETVEAFKQYREDIVSQRYKKTSPGGQVTVVIDGLGSLISLELSETVRTMRSSELSRLIVKTAQMAQRDQMKNWNNFAGKYNEKFQELANRKFI